MGDESVDGPVKPVCFCGEAATWWVNAKQTVWSGHVDLHEGFIGMCEVHRLDSLVVVCAAKGHQLGFDGSCDCGEVS